MSDNFKHTAGLQNVGSYQVSGKPFVTASTVTDGTEQQIEFPEVSNNITVKLDSASGGGSGITYNSLFFSSSFDGSAADNSLWYLTSDSDSVGTGESRTFSAWVKGGSGNQAGINNGIIFGANNTLTGFREKSNKFQFFHFNERSGDFVGAQNSIISIQVNASILPHSEWQFWTGVIEHNVGIKFYIDGQLQGSAVNDSLGRAFTSIRDASIDRIAVGPRSNMDSNFKLANLILWDAALSPTQVFDLYQASGSYDDAAYNPSGVNKLVWIKPDEAVGVAVSPINNSGSLGNLTLNGNEPGIQEASIIEDAPFADVAGSGGELRVHFRSTSSLPNVATNKHYWTLDSQNESITMNVKSKELYLSADGGDCDYSVEAELTNIPTSSMFQHTGSGVDE